ncbi:MAG: Rieske (2Fe-2S) protein, partial [Ilumatobacteraceae bacterium]
MTTTSDPVTDRRGTARSPGLTYQQLLDADTHEVPDILRQESPRFLGDADVPIDHYISREGHEREKARLWPRVWQFACREEHIPRVGDHTVYDIAGRSYVVMRSAPDTIKAFPNACLHRGRQLKQYDGNCSEIRCPFHGFGWHIDGTLKDVPAHWDLPHVTADTFSLPEVAVGTWDGFVFINPDP